MVPEFLKWGFSVGESTGKYFGGLRRGILGVQSIVREGRK